MKQALEKMFNYAAPDGTNEGGGTGKSDVDDVVEDTHKDDVHGDIPYKRFKTVIDERNAMREEVAELRRTEQARVDESLAANEEWQKLAQKNGARVRELEPLVAQVEELQTALNVVFEAEKKSIPQEYHQLIPSGMSAIEGLTYIAQNKELLMKPTSVSTGAGKRGSKDTSGGDKTFQERLSDARQSNNLALQVKIKQEAASEGVFLQ